MNKKITVHSLSDNSHYQETIDSASFCPQCGVVLVPSILYATIIEDPEDETNSKVFVLNSCPNCGECFISKHIYDDYSGTYIFESSAPTNYFNNDFSSNMQNLSPNFISIYNEASHAELLGLTSICGMGYRKALEFLVKDYAISIHPEDTEKISLMPIAQCINQYINNDHLNALAKASAWLGNDETHYVKKHTNYGLPQLKSFISAFVAFIDAELAYKEAQSFISS